MNPTVNLPIRRALMSVSDKTGIVEFARALVERGVEILSTGGTAKLLASSGVPVIEVADYTGFPEMMDGRLKTLHPKIHGGLLGRRGEDDAKMAEHAIPPIDLLVVNLYPFEATVAKPNCALADAIENIDIGGPAMLRAAAKNHAAVTVITDADDYQRVLAEMQATEQTEMSLTDADSRKMKGAHGEHCIGYNVQVAVDAQHHLIAAPEVVQAASDYGQLSSLATAAQAALAVTPLQVVADAGYPEAQQLEACAAAGITTFVPARGTTSGQGPHDRAIHPKEAFTYDPIGDAYRCPAGQTLARGYAGESRGKQCVYYYHVAACGACGQRGACTTGAYRKLSRLANEAVVEQQAQRVRAHPELVCRRQEIVEHVFGTLRNWGHDRFLMKGLEQVRAEFSLSCLTYNLRRVLNLVQMPALLAAVAAGGFPTGAVGV